MYMNSFTYTHALYMTDSKESKHQHVCMCMHGIRYKTLVCVYCATYNDR